ncbi:hypothetical protein D3C81_794150 [compost metagenome]
MVIADLGLDLVLRLAQSLCKQLAQKQFNFLVLRRAFLWYPLHRRVHNRPNLNGVLLLFRLGGFLACILAFWIDQFGPSYEFACEIVQFGDFLACSVEKLQCQINQFLLPAKRRTLNACETSVLQQFRSPKGFVEQRQIQPLFSLQQSSEQMVRAYTAAVDQGWMKHEMPSLGLIFRSDSDIHQNVRIQFMNLSFGFHNASMNQFLTPALLVQLVQHGTAPFVSRHLIKSEGFFEVHLGAFQHLGFYVVLRICKQLAVLLLLAFHCDLPMAIRNFLALDTEYHDCVITNRKRTVDGQVAQLKAGVIITVFSKYLIQHIDIGQSRQDFLPVNHMVLNNRIF